MSTQATLNHHLAALAIGVDAIMRDYTDASVLFTPQGPIKGIAGIRSFYAAFLDSSPPELLQAFAVTRTDIDGEVAYLHWKAEPFIPFATDTFLIRDGKIVAQSFAVLPPQPAAEEKPTISSSAQPA